MPAKDIFHNTVKTALEKDKWTITDEHLFIQVEDNEIIDIITTIAVYKFSSLSREEVEAMLGVTLEEIRIYQEAKAEGREQGREQGREEREAEMLKVTVPLLLKTGMSVEEIAQKLNVDVESVRLSAQENTDNL